MSDTELVGGILDGTVDYGVLVHRYEYAVLHWLVSLVGNLADAEELRQCTFIRAYARLRRYDSNKGTLGTWLHSIAHNLGVSFLRHHENAPASLDALSEEELATGGEAEVQGRAAEEALAVWRAAGTLPEMERRALVAHAVDRLTWPEIAESLGCCERTARRLAARAITGMRARLQA